jgi:hypothetical protein
MIRNPLVPFAVLGAIIAFGSTPAAAQSSCGPREQLVKLLADQYKEDPVGIGLAQPGQGSKSLRRRMGHGRWC